MKLKCVLLMVLTSLPSCGKSASDSCHDFSDIVCERDVECAATGLNVDSCHAILDASLECSNVADVSSSFDDCMLALQELSCDSLAPLGNFTLPNSCNGILIRP